VFRGDELITLRLKWAEAPTDTCFLQANDESDSEAASRRKAWLG
jgi:hypothetical protein